MVVVVKTARVIATTILHSGVDWIIIILVVIIVLLLAIQRLILGTPVVLARRRILVILSVVSVVLRFLVDFFAFTTLHPGLLQQSSLLGQTLAFLPIFDLVLPNESHWWSAENVLVLAKLADPRRIRGIVKVLVLLFDPTFASSVGVELRGATAWLSWRRCLVVWRPTRGRGPRLAARTVHARACLRALVVDSGIVRADRRSRAGTTAWLWGSCRRRIRARGLGITILLARPDHILRRVGAASEGELCLVCTRLSGLPLQQAHVLVAGVRWRRLCVGDGGGDDTLF
jgi:hypothetical protein